MAKIEDLLEEQNKLMKFLIKLMVDSNLKESNEAEKAQYLKDSGFTRGEVATILNKAESTIKTQLKQAKKKSTKKSVR